MDAASPLALLANACCSSRPAPPPAPREGPRYSHSSTTAKSAATADNSAHSSPSTATAPSSSARLPPCAAIAAAPSEPAYSPRPLSEAKPSPRARQRCEPPTPHTFAPAPYTYPYRSPCLERNVGSRPEPDRPEGFVVERRLSGTTAVDTPADFSKQTSHHEGRCQDAQATGAQAAAVPRRNPSPGGSEAGASAGLATGLVAPKREDSAPIPKREDSAAGPSPQGESEVEPCGSRHRSESAKPKKELKDSKRAEQNRAAQRAFRERKEQKLRSLQEMVACIPMLEEQLASMSSRCAALEADRASHLAAQQSFEAERSSWTCERRALLGEIRALRKVLGVERVTIPRGLSDFDSVSCVGASGGPPSPPPSLNGQSLPFVDALSTASSRGPAGRHESDRGSPDGGSEGSAPVRVKREPPEDGDGPLRPPKCVRVTSGRPELDRM